MLDVTFNDQTTQRINFEPRLAAPFSAVTADDCEMAGGRCLGCGVRLTSSYSSDTFRSAFVRTSLEEYKETVHNRRLCEVDSSCGDPDKSGHTLSLGLKLLDFIAILGLPREPGSVDTHPFPEIKHPGVVVRFFTGTIGGIERFGTNAVLAFKSEQFFFKGMNV